MAVYAVATLGTLLSIVLAATEAPPTWTFPAIITAMGSALVYAYRNAEGRANKSETEKYDLALRVTDALKESSLVLARFLDSYPEEDPMPKRRAR